MSVNQIVGKYKVERLLAVGGMAELFLARRQGPAGFEKAVVIKRILPSHQGDPRFAQMFLDEAKIGARFNHPNLIQVYELEEIDGLYCMVLEYVEGADLSHVIARAKATKSLIPCAAACFIVAEAAEGLSYAHEMRDESGRPLHIVHRDVSPANIIVTVNGAIKVVDFGIAKHEQATQQTQTNMVKGKLCYMSPEQARAEPVDERSDIFSLGAVLYELLTLKPCFLRPTPAETYSAILDSSVQPVEKLRRDVAPELIDIVKRMLAPDRCARVQSAAEVSRQLRAHLAATQVVASRDVRDLVQPLLQQAAPAQRVFTSVYSDLDAARVEDPPVSTPITAQPAARKAAGRSARIETEVLDTMVDVRPPVAKPLPVHLAIAAAVVTGLTLAGGYTLWSSSSEVRVALVEKADSPLDAAPTPDAAPAARAAVVDDRGRPEVTASDSAPDAAAAEEREPPESLEEQATATAPRAPSRRKGTLSVTSVPSAALTVDGRPVGRTPVQSLRLSPGRHKLRLQDAAIGLDRSASVVIPPGEHVQRSFTFELGTLVINARPWAEVYLGSRKLGVTPLPPLKLAPGFHRVNLRNHQLRVERNVTVNVQAGATTRLDENLQP